MASSTSNVDGARTIAGVGARIAQRILALDAAI